MNSILIVAYLYKFNYHEYLSVSVFLGMRKMTFFESSKQRLKKHDANEPVNNNTDVSTDLDGDGNKAVLEYLRNLKSLEDYSDEAAQKAYQSVSLR